MPHAICDRGGVWRDNSLRSADTKSPPLVCPRHIQWKKCPVPPARRASMTKLFQNAEVRLQMVAGDKMHWRFGQRRRGLWLVHHLTGNASFPAPPVTLTALGALQTTFTNAMATAAQGGTQLTAVKNAARE